MDLSRPAAGRHVGPRHLLLRAAALDRVNDIEHIESQSLPGIGIVKIFFQPGVDIRTATAQVTSLSQTVLKQMPPGITPPLILNYNASTVPILQLALSSATLSEQKLFDLGQNFIRPALASVRGRGDPVALWRQGTADPDRPRSAGAAGQRPVGAGRRERDRRAEPDHPGRDSQDRPVRIQREAQQQPGDVDELNDLPIKTVNGATIYMRDVAHVRDGSPPQRNEVRVDGRRAVLMSVLKSGSASTLAIIDGVKALLPKLKETLPPSLQISRWPTSRLFVKAAISGVVREGVIAAALDQPDDPAVPRQLALDGDHRHLDPAGGPLVDRGAVGVRPDAQHHDPGRPGAGGRHSGRRRHGDDREHQLAPGAGQGRSRPRSWTARSRS